MALKEGFQPQETVKNYVPKNPNFAALRVMPLAKKLPKHMYINKGECDGYKKGY